MPDFVKEGLASADELDEQYRKTLGMIEALEMMSAGLDPAGLVTHVGGLNAVIDTTLNLPNIPGGKKLIYTHIEMPLTPIVNFGKLGEKNPVYAELDKICARHKGLWNTEAEEYLLAHAAQLA